MRISNRVYAIAVLSGTIIGVGLFALPYITLKVGFLIVFGYFLVLGALVILVHLFFGELALRTPDFKRLPGFAKFYLGKWGERVSYFSTIFGFFGAILAYLIVGGKFLAELLSPIFQLPPEIFTFIYWLFGSFLIFFGIKAIAKVEFWGLILFFTILIVIFFRGMPFINLENLFIGNWELEARGWFLPYGIILFSLWGVSLIPEAEEILGKKKKMLLKIIPIAILIPMIIYLFFICLILGITGLKTTESALTGLREVLGGEIVSLILFFGILTTFTSFIALGLTLKKVFWYDLKLTKNLAWVITCFLPLFLFLIGIKEFIFVISFVGTVMLGIDGILILLMYHKLQVKSQKLKVKSLLIYPLFLVFLGGIIYQIIYFVK